MLDSQQKLKLMDLGLAKVSTGTEGKTKIVVGTPHYMSPEQFKEQKEEAEKAPEAE